MKLITGLLLIVITVVTGIMCVVHPDTYDIVGLTIKTGQKLMDIHWLIPMAILLAGGALIVYTSAIEAMEDNVFYFVAIIGYAAVGLIVTALAFFNVYLDRTYSVWYNVIPLGLLLLVLIVDLCIEDIEWWRLILTFFGFYVALCVGCIICVLLAAVIGVILCILGVVAMLYIAQAVLSSH